MGRISETETPFSVETEEVMDGESGAELLQVMPLIGIVLDYRDHAFEVVLERVDIGNGVAAGTAVWVLEKGSGAWVASGEVLDVATTRLLAVRLDRLRRPPQQGDLVVHHRPDTDQASSHCSHEQKG